MKIRALEVLVAASIPVLMDSAAMVTSTFAFSGSAGSPVMVPEKFVERSSNVGHHHVADAESDGGVGGVDVPCRRSAIPALAASRTMAIESRVSFMRENLQIWLSQANAGPWESMSEEQKFAA